MPKIKRKKEEPDGSTKQQLHAEDGLAEATMLQDVENDEGIPESNRVYSVVKMKLNSFVIGGDKLKTKIRSIVHDMNILLAEAYLFGNYHITRLLASRDPAVTADELPSVDKNFYYRCLLAVSRNKCRPGTLGADFAASISAFDAMRPAGVDKVDATEYNQLIADAAISMATMASNHLWTNLARRVTRYLSWNHRDLSKMLRTKVVAAVAERPTESLDRLFAAPAGASAAAVLQWSRARHVASGLRDLAPRTRATQSAPQARLLLPLYHHILRETEAAKCLCKKEETRKGFRGRTFTLLPTKRSFTTSHVQFSKMALLGILKRLKLEAFAGDGRGVGDAEVEAIWRRHFHLRPLETESRRFKGRIVTDGCAVAVVMTKESRATCCVASVDSAALRKCLHGGWRFVGVDPGVSDVATVAELENPKTRSYSSARYYEDAHYNTSRRRIDKWNAETAAQAEGLAGGGRTADLAAFEAHARAYLAAVRPLTAHRLSRGYRNMRFLRFVGKQKAVDDICKTIAPRDGRSTVVGFGDWSGLGGSCPIRRRCAGPLQAIKFQLSKRPDVLLTSVDEFKTSQTCHGCFNKLCNMRADSTRVSRGVAVVTRGASIHKVLHCKKSRDDGSESRCRATWNRDVNASKNILMLLLLETTGEARPPAFCRAPVAKPARLARPASSTPGLTDQKTTKDP